MLLQYLLFVSNSLFVQSQADATNVMNSYEQSLRALESAEFQLKMEDYFSSSLKPLEACVNSQDIHYVRDHDRSKITVRMQGDKTDPIEIEFVQSKQDSINAQKIGSEVLLSAAMQQPNKHFALSAYLGDAAVLLGYLPGDGGTYLPEILRASSLTVSPSEIDGDPVQLLHGKGAHGEYKLWLDFNRSFQPRRIAVKKEGSDLSGGTALSTFSMPAGGLWPAGRFQSFELEVRNVKLAALDAISILQEFEVRATYGYDNGSTAVTRSTCALSNINLKPNFRKTGTFSIAMEIPDGTPVAVRDAPMINHEWLDGKIIKTINPESLATLEGHGFLGSKRARGWFLFFNFVLLGGLVAYLLIRRRRIGHF